MWAMMPMLRTRSSSSIFGTPLPVCVCVTAMPALPPVVGEGLVGLRHSVDVVLLLVGAALLVGGVQDLCGKLLVHLLLAPLPREGDQPAHGRAAAAPPWAPGSWRRRRGGTSPRAPASPT